MEQKSNDKAEQRRQIAAPVAGGLTGIGSM
jgi:hypothetical protein